jgi:hypothetical protein
MGKYNCGKCGKEFNQKSHYTTHITPTEKKNETKIFIFYVVLPFYLIILNVFKNN